MRAFLPLVWSAKKPATTPPTIEPYSKLFARFLAVSASALVVSYRNTNGGLVGQIITPCLDVVWEPEEEDVGDQFGVEETERELHNAGDL